MARMLVDLGPDDAHRRGAGDAKRHGVDRD